MTGPCDRDVCWYCGGKLCWDSDCDYSEVHGTGRGIVTFLHCLQCGAEVQYSRAEKGDGHE